MSRKAVNGAKRLRPRLTGRGGDASRPGLPLPPRHPHHPRAAVPEDDQAGVEQRNWTAVRRLVGYGRLTSKAAFVQLGCLYAPLRLYFNFFHPLPELVAKERVGGRVRKRYDAAATPYRPLLAAETLDEDRRAALDALRPVAEPDRGWTPALAAHIPGVPITPAG